VKVFAWSNGMHPSPDEMGGFKKQAATARLSNQKWTIGKRGINVSEHGVRQGAGEDQCRITTHARLKRLESRQREMLMPKQHRDCAACSERCAGRTRS
jgi:hypothetical protein